MGNTLNELVPEIAVAQIVQYGEKLILPEGMKIPTAINLLERRMQFEEETTNFTMEYDVLPYDGAYALDRCLVAKFGWAPAEATPGFWEDTPPQMVRIETDYHVWTNVAWGRFNLPNISGFIATDVARQPNGRFKFQLQAMVERKDERAVRELFDEVNTYLRDHSIYKGKAVKIRFLLDNGKDLPMPDVKFLNAKSVEPNSVIFSRELEEQINVNLFIPITRVHDCIRNRVAVKRGVLLGGTYGVGKTMAASVASRMAVDSGITYVYSPRANELKLAIEFAKQYQSPACMVFCEDVDRVTDGKRGVELDDLLNIIDGIDTKSSNIITVLTTNELDKVNPAMLRPGRLDAVIELQAPDAEAVERLIRHYGGEVIAANEDLTEVGAVLAGQIPAMVSEVVKRAKLYQIGEQEPGTEVRMIGASALLYAAKTMRAQLDLLERRTAAQQVQPPTLDETFRGVMADVYVNGGAKTVAGEIIKAARPQA